MAGGLAAKQGAVIALALAAIGVTPARAWAEGAAPAAAAAAAAAPVATAPTPVVAATAATPLTVRPTHPMSYASEPAGLGAGWKLGLMGLAVAGGWFFWNRRRQQRPAAPVPRIRVVARQSVGVRSQILIVEIEGDRLLLGVTPQNISRIGDLPPVDERGPAGEPAGDFAAAMRAQELAREIAGTRPRDREPPADVSARISALLGHPELDRAPVITTRGARRDSPRATKVSVVVGGAQGGAVDDDASPSSGPAGGVVEEQARGLLRAARRA